MIELAPHLFLHRDTTNVYVIRSGRTATSVDFGDGTVLDPLGTIEVDEITDVVMTHHHRAPPTQVTPEYLDVLRETGQRIADLHRELLPLEELDFGAEGVGLRIEPYRPVARAGEPLALDVHVRNPFAERRDAQVELLVPLGWDVAEPRASVSIAAKAEATLAFEVTPPAGVRARRARVGADLTVGQCRFGLQAEALVTVEPEGGAE